MNENIRYEILEALPVYGAMYIPITDNGEPYFSQGYAIRFYKSDGTNWVANFKPGWTNLNRVFDFPQHDIIVVIASGIGYVMKTDDVKPIKTFGLGINQIFQTENGSLICEDGLSIQYFDSIKGDIWFSERISFDGFKDLVLKGDVISGLSVDPTNSNLDWNTFSLNVKTKVIIGGSYRNFQNQNPEISKIKLKDENVIKLW